MIALDEFPERPDNSMDKYAQNHQKAGLKNLVFLVSALCIVLFSATTVWSQRELYVVTEQWVPYVFEDASGVQGKGIGKRLYSRLVRFDSSEFFLI